MVDYVLKRDAEGMVRYLYRNDGKHPYVGKTKIESAEWMLRQGEVVVSDEHEGFPVTANGMYFFEADVKGELPQSPTATAPSGRATPSDPLRGPAPSERATPSVTLRVPAPSEREPDDNAEIGADGLPMHAGAEKPRRKKRVKDVVCE